MLCFIQLTEIKEFQKIKLEKLSSVEKINDFIDCLKEYLFKLSPQIYNYAELINYFKAKNSNANLEKVYCE